jgi:hypothetical protein
LAVVTAGSEQMTEQRLGATLAWIEIHWGIDICAGVRDDQYAALQDAIERFNGRISSHTAQGVPDMRATLIGSGDALERIERLLAAGDLANEEELAPSLPPPEPKTPLAGVTLRPSMSPLASEETVWTAPGAEDGKEFFVPWIHTGKFEATYRIRAQSQEEADAFVEDHRLDLDPAHVLLLDDNAERMV